MQEGKCCFCEREYECKWSTVEHFRPKTVANRGDGIVDVGYWWLAYDFANLYFACQNCNSPKKDHFPLVDGTVAKRMTKANRAFALLARVVFRDKGVL
jgi:uncharacterized protein (TIGR02646 family)